MQKLIFFIFVSIAVLQLTACVTNVPKNTKNICEMAEQNPKWYWEAQAVQKRWGIPISIQMAIIYQESNFHHNAKPPHQRLLGFIPWFRPTSAFGYSQATDESWRVYQRSTGNSSANRDNFSDTLDFIGWYADQTHRRTGVSKRDPYKLYLAYHEGIGGYSKGTYLHKQWLINVAHKVDRRAWSYHNQLLHCHADLPKKHWWNIA